MNAFMIGAMTLNCYVSEGMGKRHYSRILESLGRASYDTSCPCHELIRRAAASRGSNHGVIFITPGGDAALERDAKAMVEGFGGTIMILRGREWMGK